jgi:hypothetical protein
VQPDCANARGWKFVPLNAKAHLARRRALYSWQGKDSLFRIQYLLGAERAAQALKLAEERRIMELSARKASLHRRKAGAVKSRAAHQHRLGKLAQSKPR